MKTFRSTGLFALFVIALALASYFIVYRGAQQKKEAKDKASILFPFKVGDVTEVDIDSAEKKLHLKKDGAEWKLLEPVQYKADSNEVEIFIEALLEEKSLDQVRNDDHIPWNVFGLDKPDGSVTIVANGKSKKVLIGTRKSYDNSRYLRFDGENKVLLVSSSWTTYLNKDSSSLRDKKIFSADTNKVVEIKIHAIKDGKSTATDLVRDDQKQWKIKGEPKLMIDQSSIHNYLNQLKNIQVSDFVSEDKTSKEDLKKLGFEGPLALDLELKLQGEKGSFTTWGIKGVRKINKKDKFDIKSYALTTDLNPIFQIPNFSLEGLQKESNDFRDKREPFKFKLADVRGIKYHSSLFSTELVKERGVWKLKNPKDDEEVVRDQVTNLLNDLNSMQAEKFLGTRHGKGLSAPKAQITLTGKNGEEIFKIKWGDEFKESSEKDAKTLVYVQTSDSDETVGVDASFVRDLPGQTLVKTKSAPKSVVPKTATGKPKASGA